MFLLLVFLTIPVVLASSGGLDTSVETLYPNLKQVLNLSIVYSNWRTNNTTSLVSSFCDILLSLEEDLDSCGLYTAGDLYLVDRGGAAGAGRHGRRLSMRPAVEPPLLDEGFLLDPSQIFVEYISEPRYDSGQEVRYYYRLLMSTLVTNLPPHLPTCILFSTCGTSATDTLVLISCAVGLGLNTVTLIWLWVERKSKVLSTSMTPLLGSIIIGSSCTYSCLILRCLIPTSILIPWTKELGFGFTYGGIVLKIYRYLVEFRTRKAHRWIVREKDLLRYLSGILSIILFYILSYSLTFPSWRSTSPWSSICELGEMGYLLFAINMAWHIRNSSTNYNEKLLLTLCCVLELLACANILLSIGLQYYAGLHLGIWSFYAKEFGINLTTVGIAVWSKILYVMRDKKARKVTSRVTLDYNGDLPEINLDEMEISDIRTELKRVYTQCELLRNKTMRKDNPHISKRRGGRKPTHRRFSLQKRGSREKALRRQQRSFRVNIEDIEDSVCSVEGVSTYSEAGR